MPQNKISIAIPAHNEEDSIQTNLQSILDSEFHGKKIEVVVCLSACTDNTKERVEEFKKNHNRVDIKIIESKTKGKVRAYKSLDEYIQNDIIVFLDADCGSKSDAIYRVYNTLRKSGPEIKIVSGNAVDGRYTNKNIKPKSLIEAFNRSFWQHPPRKVVNGQFFAERKGVVQKIPDEIKLDDIYMSITLWDNFLKDNEAQIAQGSPQKMYEVVRYQKNIQSGIRQIRETLSNKVDNFDQIAKELYGQFDVKISDKKMYYPNISIWQILAINFLIFVGKVWGSFTKPSWSQTKGSKQIDIN